MLRRTPTPSRLTQVRKPQAGFTLLELLVAMTMLAMLSVLMFGGVQFGVRAWESARSSGDGTDDIGAAQDFLRRLIAQAEPAFYRDPRYAVQRTRVAFVGEAGRLEFVAPLSQFAGLGGRYHIGLQLGRDAGRQDLVLRWQGFSTEHVGFTFMDGMDGHVLLRDVVELHASYFGRANDADRDKWLDAWPSDKTLPRLIRLEVAFPTGDPRIWPELVAPIVTTKSQM